MEWAFCYLQVRAIKNKRVLTLQKLAISKQWQRSKSAENTGLLTKTGLGGHRGRGKRERQEGAVQLRTPGNPGLHPNARLARGCPVFSHYDTTLSSTKLMFRLRAGEMAQWVKCLPLKCEEQRLHLQNLCEARSGNTSVITPGLQQDGRQKQENPWELETIYPYTQESLS